MLHAGLDLSRRKLDICLLSDQGEHLDQLVVPPDVDSLKTLAGRIEEPTTPAWRGGQPLKLLSQTKHGSLTLGCRSLRAGVMKLERPGRSAAVLAVVVVVLMGGGAARAAHDWDVRCGSQSAPGDASYYVRADKTRCSVTRKVARHVWLTADFDFAGWHCELSGSNGPGGRVDCKRQRGGLRQRVRLVLYLPDRRAS